MTQDKPCGGEELPLPGTVAVTLPSVPVGSAWVLSSYDISHSGSWGTKDQDFPMWDKQAGRAPRLLNRKRGKKTHVSRHIEQNVPSGEAG